MTAVDIKEDMEELQNVSARTVRRRLREFKLFGCRPAKKPWISAQNKKKRLAFAKRYRFFTAEDWRQVLWTDESAFCKLSQHRGQYVRRPPKSRFNPKYVKPTVKFGAGKLMVWGCFSWYGVGPIHRIEGILNQYKYLDIMRDQMLPFAEENMPDQWILQQDNDPKHTAKSVKHWFDDQELQVLEWPSQSPDLNPIEHVWSYLEKQLAGTKFKTFDELFNVLEQKWNEIPDSFLESLVESMPRRLNAVIKAHGGPTKY